MSSATLPPLPSVERYIEAFRTMIPGLTDGQLGMLRAHYRAPKHTLTATQLAEAAEYAAYTAVNLQYGKMGEHLRDLLGYRSDAAQSSYSFASFVKPVGAPDSQGLWVMHPQVVEALRQLRF